jgi:tryptophan 2,3-dioxygenase
MEFHNGCTVQAENGLWRPALTASARLKYGSRVLLPAFTGFLANSGEKDETFNSLEFYKFREYLPPASGFQTAQFRLIQRGLGKSNLFSIRLFPAQKYRKHYEDKPDAGPARVVDPVILREGARTAVPDEDSPLSAAAGLDDLAHRLLVRLSGFREDPYQDLPVLKIGSREIEAAAEGYRQILAGHRNQQKKTGSLPADAEDEDRRTEMVFRKDLEKAAAMENERREKLKSARAGAFYLHTIASGSHLARVLNRIVTTDNALHGPGEESFLSVHYRMAAQRIHDVVEHARKIGKPEPPSGTGGGGIPYLWFMRKNLIPLFPALVGFRDVADTPSFGWIE